MVNIGPFSIIIIIIIVYLCSILFHVHFFLKKILSVLFLFKDVYLSPVFGVVLF